MSRDLEAGILDEEKIPLVRIVGRDRQEDKRHEIITDMAGDQTVELKMKYKIDICEEEGNETFKFMKVKTKSSAEEVATDAERFVKIAECAKSIFICVDDAEHVSDKWVQIVNRISRAFIANLMFLTNGLGHQILNRVNARREVKTVCVISTSFVTGTAVKNSNDSKKYCGVLDHQKRETFGPRVGIRAALLLEDASPDDVMKYKLAILKAYSEVEPYCMKVIIDGSKELLNSMADNSYFSDRRGVLILKNGGLLSSLLYSFVEAFRNGSEMVEQAEEDVKSVCQEYFPGNDCNYIFELVIENIKQNFAIFFTFDETEEIDKERLGSAIIPSLVQGLHAPVNLLIDSSKEIYDTLSNPEYFKINNTTLISEESGEIPYLLADFVQCGNQKMFSYGLIEYFEGVDGFVASMKQNISKLKVYDANNPESNSMLLRAVTFMEKVIINRPSYLSPLVAQKFSYLAITSVLRENRPEIFGNWPFHQIEIDTYIYCNLRFHWHDQDERNESKVGNHFGILHYRNYDKPKWQHMGRNINKAIEKLSNGIIANCFHEDGKPNVEIISPIQALIINRLFCMQLDFVKMLWKFDKENILVNTVMIWILINGILKEKIFARESAADDLVKLKEYLAAAIKWPLDKLLKNLFQMELLEDRIMLFRGQPLFLAAGEGEFCEFLTHTVTKRCISREWDHCDLSYGPNKMLAKVLNKPRIKLYIHMVMYVVSYLLLAYYTLQQRAKASGVLKWVLLTMISSLFVDELRQALGDKQYSIRISLKRWWSDGWNKLDAFSMMIYYIAFILECAGVINASRLLFSIFTFIWCLKFYQFLRAFESLGTYIILVQKMLPQLGNFSIVALIAIISYGVFMTSILFPNITFKSWSVFIMVLLRPYLLLFAETGINEYDLSTKNTIYNTPKIETASEIIMVVGMCVFLMFGGVLLLNLLIAIFSGIYEEVKEESVKLWALNDLQLLQEFQRKPVVPIPFSLPVNIFLLFKRRLTKPLVYSYRYVHSSLNFKQVQRDLTEKLPEWNEKQERSSDSIIRDIDTQVAELNQMYQFKTKELQSAMGSQHEDVKEILKEHQENSLKMMEKKVEELEGSIGETAKDVNKRVDDIEKKMDNVDIRCQEISTLLKQLIESAKG